VQKPAILQVLPNGRGPTRTGDPLGVNEVLWPTELRAPGCPRLTLPSRLPVPEGSVVDHAYAPTRARRLTPPLPRTRACG
jgi:hypothetical protein